MTQSAELTALIARARGDVTSMGNAHLASKLRNRAIAPELAAVYADEAAIRLEQIERQQITRANARAARKAAHGKIT